MVGLVFFFFKKKAHRSCKILGPLVFFTTLINVAFSTVHRENQMKEEREETNEMKSEGNNNKIISSTYHCFYY